MGDSAAFLPSLRGSEYLQARSHGPGRVKVCWKNQLLSACLNHLPAKTAPSNCPARKQQPAPHLTATRNAGDGHHAMQALAAPYSGGPCHPGVVLKHPHLRGQQARPSGLVLRPLAGGFVMSATPVYTLREELLGHLMEAALQSELRQKHLVGPIVITVERCPEQRILANDS